MLVEWALGWLCKQFLECDSKEKFTPVCFSCVLTLLLSQSQHFWYQVCVCFFLFFPTPSNSLWHQLAAGCATIQFNSDTKWNHCRHHRWRTQYQETALRHFRCQLPAGLQVAHTFFQLGYKFEVPRSSPASCQAWSQLFARTAHSLRVTLVFTSLLYNKGYGKGYRRPARCRST